MRRVVHIALTLVLVLLLVRPFDCFAGMLTRKAADCCAKGKCLPKGDADDCCKNSTPDGNQLLASKSHHLSAPIPDFTVLAVSAMLPELHLFVAGHVYRSSSPPGSPPGIRQNLPLLI
jgi:hypothetical protein